jgi:hypothetical protein
MKNQFSFHLIFYTKESLASRVLSFLWLEKSLKVPLGMVSQGREESVRCSRARQKNTLKNSICAHTTQKEHPIFPIAGTSRNRHEIKREAQKARGCENYFLLGILAAAVC